MKLRAIHPRHLLGPAQSLATLLAVIALGYWSAPDWAWGAVLGVMLLVSIGVAVAFRSEDWGDPDEADL